MNLFDWLFPASIEIVACEIASKVAVDDTVHVDHWEKTNVIVFQQPLTRLGFMLEELLHYFL